MLIISTIENTDLELRDDNEKLVKEMLGKFDRDSLVNIFDESGKFLETIKIKDLFNYAST